MKSTVESLKATTGSGYVRAISASAVLVPLAVVAAGVKLSNHNETVVRAATMSGYVRAISAMAVLVPLAAVAAGMDLGNHNETVARQEVQK